MTLNAPLVIIAPAELVGDAPRASGYVYVVILGRPGFVVEVMIPVEIAKICVRRYSVPGFLYNPRPFRYLYLIASPVVKALIIVVGVLGVRNAGNRGEHKGIGQFCSIVTPCLEVGRNGVRRKGIPCVEDHLGRRVLLSSTGGYENHPEGSSYAVDG